MDQADTLSNELRHIAKAWIQAGAARVTLWTEEEPIWTLPKGADPSMGSRLEIAVSSAQKLSLSINWGALPDLTSALAQQLASLKRCAEAERALDEMTEAMIQTQDQLLALYDLAQTTRSRVELADLLPSLVQETWRLVQPEAAFVWLTLDDEQPYAAQAPEPHISSRAMQRALDTVALADQRLLWNPGETNSQPKPLHDDRALLAIPLRIREHISAVIGLVNPLGKAFSSPDVKLAGTIARHAESQIENLLLYRETVEQARLHTEMEIAREVQLHLLSPSCPVNATKFLDLYATMQPARIVGGDFYDILCTRRDRVVVVIGDVSGKGMPAALLMSRTQGAIRSTLSFLPEAGPAAILRQVNEHLYGAFSDVGMFATAFVAQYEASSQTLTYANAGHAPVIYSAHGGSPRLLRADATALGILPRCDCRDHRLKLRHGDLLVAGTDGFNESESEDGRMFGLERLLQLVASSHRQSAQEVAENIFGAVASFTGHTPRSDDQTILVLKRRPGARS
jgi:phosphoserine phosphatase RsbU/P